MWLWKDNNGWRQGRFPGGARSLRAELEEQHGISALIPNLTILGPTQIARGVLLMTGAALEVGSTTTQR